MMCVILNYLQEKYAFRLELQGMAQLTKQWSFFFSIQMRKRSDSYGFVLQAKCLWFYEINFILWYCVTHTQLPVVMWKLFKIISTSPLSYVPKGCIDIFKLVKCLRNKSSTSSFSCILDIYMFCQSALEVVRDCQMVAYFLLIVQSTLGSAKCSCLELESLWLVYTAELTVGIFQPFCPHISLLVRGFVQAWKMRKV